MKVGCNAPVTFGGFVVKLNGNVKKAEAAYADQLRLMAEDEEYRLSVFEAFDRRMTQRRKHVVSAPWLKLPLIGAAVDASNSAARHG